MAEGGLGLHTMVGAGGVRATRQHLNRQGEVAVSARPPGTVYTLAVTILRLPLHGMQFMEVRTAVVAG